VLIVVVPRSTRLDAMREYELNGGGVPYPNTEYTLAPPAYSQRPTSMQQQYGVDTTDSYYAPRAQLVYQSPVTVGGGQMITFLTMYRFCSRRQERRPVVLSFRITTRIRAPSSRRPTINNMIIPLLLHFTNHVLSIDVHKSGILFL
jgi:hypothetical protein